MKTIKLTLSLILSLVASSALAQLVTIGPSTGTGAPGNVEASTVKVYQGSGTNVTLDCRAQQNVAVQVEFACLGAGTDVCGFHFVGKVDPAVTNVSGDILTFIMAAAANGTSTVKLSTNFNVVGYPYLQLNYVSNAVAQVMTNVTIKYWVKKNAP